MIYVPMESHPRVHYIHIPASFHSMKQEITKLNQTMKSPILQAIYGKW